MRLRPRSLDPRRLWFSQRGLLLLALVVVATSMGTVVWLRTHASRDSRAALLATRLSGEINRLSGLESQAVEDRLAGGSRMEDELARTTQSVRSIVEELGDVGGVDAIFPPTRRYVAAVAAELGLLESGQVSQAIRLARSTVDPLYDRLEPQLNAIATRRAESAQSATLRANIGALIAILVTAGAVAILLWKLLRTREASQATTRERDYLRKLDTVKDTLIATVSHELRTPLASILGYTELLLEGHGGPVSPDQEQCLRTIERNGNRLLRLVEDLLLLSRIEAGQLHLRRMQLDLAPLVSEATDAHGPSAREAGIALVTDLAEARVDGDPARIGQLVDNLVSNAIKFTPEGGRVQVTLRAVEGDAVLTVSDTGIGIARDEQERLFDRFYRTQQATERAIQGTGLGLSIVKAIAEAHLGQVAIESTPGDGSTFSVRFPLAGARAEANLLPAGHPAG